MASSKDVGSSKLYMFGVVGMGVAAVAVACCHFARSQEITTVRGAKALVAERGPRIEVVTTTAGPTVRSIKLLGDIRSGATTVLYSKVAGYLKTVYVDKGDKVEAGQVVAEIESPELDQAYAGASADFANKQRNLARIRGLYEKGNATQVAMLQAETDALVAENAVAVLATNKAYQIVRSPFAGRRWNPPRRGA